MRLTEVCGPVNNGKETEAHGEHHERELVERAVLCAAEHHAAIHRLPQPHQEAGRPVPGRHGLQYWGILKHNNINNSHNSFLMESRNIVLQINNSVYTHSMVVAISKVLRHQGSYA